MGTSSVISLAGILMVSTFCTSALMEGDRELKEEDQVLFQRRLKRNQHGVDFMTKPAKEAAFGLREEVELLCKKPPSIYEMKPGDRVNFSSPSRGRRHRYHRNADCGWMLIGTNISIYCHIFRTQRPKDGACVDYLSINGTKYCGKYGQRPIIHNKSNLLIEFYSDEKWARRGFECVATTEPYNSDEEPSPILNACTCGIANRRTRISGGIPVESNEFPWIAALVKRATGELKPDDFQDLFAVASILSMFWVLTTACSGVTLEDQVIVGAHSMHSSSSPRLRVDISSIVVPPGYNCETKGIGGDAIALVRLAEALDFNDRIGPVCLPRPGTAHSGTATVAGWGARGDQVSDIPVFPFELYEVELEVLPNADCTQFYPNMDDSRICTWSDTIGKGTCQGDSGGPLTTEFNGRYIQIGIATEPHGCSSTNVEIYIRITSYIGWIASIVGSDQLCFH